MKYKFTACRVTGGDNVVFPDEIIVDIDEELLIHRKPYVIGCKETKIRFASIGCITVNRHILFSDIVIETKGGKEIRARGFTHFDAKRIASLIE